MQPVNYLSLFSGIEAATLAWRPLGWVPLGFAEVEPFASAVLQERYPDVPNLGDVTKVDWASWKAQHGSPDVLIAGAPCQSFSYAGLRGSLEDARGNLTLYTTQLVRFLNPRVFIFENVPGILGTKDNAFGCFLSGLVGGSEPVEPQRGKWGNSGVISGPERRAAWRVLDAQYFGVPQRRRRVFVVASPLDGPDPAKILFEFESGGGDVKKNTRQRQTSTSSTDVDSVVSSFVRAQLSGGYTDVHQADGESKPIVFDRASWNQGYGASWGLTISDIDSTPTIVARGPHGVCAPVTIASAASNAEYLIDKAGALLARGHKQQQMVAYPLQDVLRANKTMNGVGVSTDEVSYTLDTMGCQGCVIVPAYVARKLLPVECSRLQGFPDDFARIPWKGKSAEDCPDSHQYRVYGNSIAVPVLRWIGERVSMS